jgi:hypothetical protein
MIELDKREVELQHAKEAAERAQTQVKALAEAQPLLFTMGAHRVTKAVTFQHNARDEADLTLLVGGLEAVLAELRAVQLRLAEERGKAASAAKADAPA